MRKLDAAFAVPFHIPLLCLAILLSAGCFPGERVSESPDGSLGKPTGALVQQNTASSAADKQANSSGLRLEIRSEKAEAIRTHEKILITVEIHNDGNNAQVVYLPGIKTRFIWLENWVKRDGASSLTSYPAEIRRARDISGDAAVDFILLLPGEFFGRTHSVRAPESHGEFTFEATYANSTVSQVASVNAWVGSLSTASTRVRVVGGEAGGN